MKQKEQEQITLDTFVANIKDKYMMINGLPHKISTGKQFFDIKVTELLTDSVINLLRKKVYEFYKSEENDVHYAVLWGNVLEQDMDDEYCVDGYFRIDWEPQLEGTIDHRNVKFGHMKTIRFWTWIKFIEPTKRLSPKIPLRTIAGGITTARRG